MKIYIGSDHGGFRLKAQLKKYLAAKKINYVDVGATRYVATDDYPDYAYVLAKKVATTKQKGILICRNGIGVCIVANKVAGIRAVSTADPAVAKTSRADDDTNVLCIGQDFTSFPLAKKIVDRWLKTKFSNEIRHRRRIRKIAQLERDKRR